ncbi:recombinase RecT, partial [Salmonella enterica]|nr:enterohemolysin [Salmonella enterica]EAX3609572.1 recombinase RecT [Salmonella enterica]EGW6283126.1 recombinase RecT [Salmonella enterica]
ADEMGIGIIIRATLKGEDKPRELNLLLAQARTRNSTLWADDPRQQLAYLAVKRWARLYCPDVILGVYTPDELEEREEKVINPVSSDSPHNTVIEDKPSVNVDALADE